jgi:hypothetical protein
MSVLENYTMRLLVPPLRLLGPPLSASEAFLFNPFFSATSRELDSPSELLENKISDD